MGKIADALDRQARDATMGAISGRVAAIGDTGLELWVKGGNKVERDEVGILYPSTTLKWGTKTQLRKFVDNVRPFDRVPFIVVKRDGNIVVKFTY